MSEKLKRLKSRLALLGYCVYPKGNVLQVSKENRSVTKKELRWLLRGEFNKLDVSVQSTGRYDYLDIEDPNED